MNGIEERTLGMKVWHGAVVTTEPTFGQGKTITMEKGNGGSSTTECVAVPAHFHHLSHEIFQGFQGYDTHESYDDNRNGHPHNRQVDHSQQDYGQDDRQQRGAVAKKRLTPSEPSPHVIFLGLDPDFTEADVCRLSCSYTSCTHD